VQSRGPVEPMRAQAVDRLLVGAGLVYEIKLDGFRCLAQIDRNRGVHLA
jgi:ATP-dependent DNA ligase